LAHQIATASPWAENKGVPISLTVFHLLTGQKLKKKHDFIFYNKKAIGTAIETLKAMLDPAEPDRLTI